VRKLPWWVTGIGLFALLLLYLPLAGVVVQSFNVARLGLDWQGFTLNWYRLLAQDADIREAAGNTLVVAGVSTLISTVLGTMLAFGLARFPWSRRRLSSFENVVYLPVIAPEMVLAAALVIALTVLRYVSSIFDFGLIAVIVGHVTFQVSFVALTVRSRLAELPLSLDEAACDLYSGGWNRFRRVTLPLLMPGVTAGGLLAFILSLDDFVITFFAAGPRAETLPIFIYASQRRGITPEIHALSTLILACTFVFVLAATRFMRGGGAKAAPGH
jgi:spermidine/putrescine transport system permease protein